MQFTKTFLVTIICFYCSAAFAQKKAQLFIHAGPNVNHFHDSNPNAFSNSYHGFNVGIGAKKSLSNHINLAWGFTFEQIGAASNGLFLLNQSGNGFDKVNAHRVLNYLSFPIYTELTTGKKIKLKLEAGIFAGMLLNNTIKVRFEETTSSGQGNYHMESDGFKKFNAGILAGVGTEIPVSKKINLQFVVRDQLGVVGLDENSNSAVTKTNSICFLGGINYSF